MMADPLLKVSSIKEEPTTDHGFHHHIAPIEITPDSCRAAGGNNQLVKQEAEEEPPLHTIKNDPGTPPSSLLSSQECYPSHLTPKNECNSDEEGGAVGGVSLEQTMLQDDNRHCDCVNNNNIDQPGNINHERTHHCNSSSKPHDFHNVVSSENRHQSSFTEAIQQGDYSEVARILDFGTININRFDDEGQTALHRVCCDGQIEIVKLLVSFGADVRLCNRDGWSPLHLACFAGHHHIVTYLISALKH